MVNRDAERLPVRGVNYFNIVPVGSGYEDRFFSPAVFDPAVVRRDFTELVARGYTTVRLFLDTRDLILHSG